MTADIIPIHSAREIGPLLAEIATAEGKLRRAERDWYVTHSEADANRANDHEDRLNALRTEAIAIVERELGVTWNALIEALA